MVESSIFEKVGDLLSIDIVKTGKQVLTLEADSLARLAESLDSSFDQAVGLIRKSRGKVVVSGMGKAGLVGTKIAATFASLGTSSFFMHPAEASHGDLGMVSAADVLLLLSNSGSSTETTALLSPLGAIGVKIIAITSKPESALGEKAHVVLSLGKFEEACLMKLAPTTSTTLMLALGDALAVAAMQANTNFDEKRYAFLHPAGALGKKLLPVKEIMRRGDEVVICDKSTEVKAVLFAITSARSGLALIVGEDKRLVGVFTDGDLRRALEKNQAVLQTQVGEVMTRHPKTIHEKHFAMEAIKRLRHYKIGDLPVVDETNSPVGVISVKDLLVFGLV